MLISRSIAFLMRASKGCFTHDSIMRLTWRQFETYLEAFTFTLRQESDKGRGENELDDAVMLSSDDDFKTERERAIEKAKEYKKYGSRGVKGVSRKLV
jgi:hypothetical protein